MTICIVDTSVLVELLNVPNMSSRHHEIKELLKQKITENEKLFLPMATILETGNHIAQNGDGTLRRKTAERFKEQIQKALDGESPFTPIQFPARKELTKWLERYPDSVAAGSGLGDISIICDWENMCRIHPGHRIYIWSLDHHLSSYDRIV